MERVSKLQQSDEEAEPDPENDSPFARTPRKKRLRSSRPAIGSSDDDEDSRIRSSAGNPDPKDPGGEPHEEQLLEYIAARDLPMSVMHETNSHDEEDDLEANDEEPLSSAYLQAPEAVQVAAGSVVTRSGRHSRKPLPLSPALSQAPRPRRGARAHIDVPETRDQRMQRRHRLNQEKEDEAYGLEVLERSRARPRRSGSYRLDVDADPEENDVDHEESVEKDDDMTVPGQSHARATRSHVGKAGERAARDGRRRVSSRRRSSGSLAEDAELVYEMKEEPLNVANGVRRTRRSVRNLGKFVPGIKNSDGEVEGDGDFPSPGTGEDSDDVEDRGFEEQEVLDDHRDASESDSEHQRPTLRRSTRSKRARKAQPQRSVAEKRPPAKRRSKRPESSLARETRKSYRPRRESTRPADFYPEVESSDDSFSSQDPVPAAKRLRPTRAAANRAGDAIANKLAPEDYLKNPMSTIDVGVSLRQPRTGRYDRRRSRLRPTGKDPFASDGDDPFGAASAVVGIEPIQVDPNISWEDVGGLDHHIRALKEMVALPLLYPEVFEKFNMEAPKGVLFYGPPGTGKTLCARALAASCGIETETEAGNLDGSGSKGESAEGQPHSKNIPEKGKAMEQKGTIDKTGMREPEPAEDVLMPDVVNEHNTVIGENGLPEPEGAEGEGQGQNVDNGIGPHTLAAEHESVVAVRSKDVQTRVQSDQGTEPATKPLTSKGGKPAVKKKPRVSFFMRNGADCLSKWVGEAERQLRMTFEAAKKHQPSIIFFDEIDGLAPVRSSRQDQIHSSIVSTLLGLMDGLDARGKVVVIGATNRVDAIDPALRRPGRFDRELIFTLPNMDARKRILRIHTSKWAPPPTPSVLDAVAKTTVGYCGADLKSLCSEAAIRALRRRYPQIYESKEKLLIDVNQVKVTTRDFATAMKEIVPSSHRSARTHARPISERLTAVLREPLQACLSLLERIFSEGLNPGTFSRDSIAKGSPHSDKRTEEETKGHKSPELSSDSEEDEDDEVVNFEGSQARIADAGRFRPGARSIGMSNDQTLRPRLLICGMQGLGQAQLGPALLHRCESCPVHVIDFPSLHADSGTRSAEEALISAFREALRSVPSILYLPHLQLWWQSASDSLRTTLIIAMKDLPADLPLLVLATAETALNDLPSELTEMLGETVELSAPSEQGRAAMFAPLLQEAQTVPRMSEAAVKHLKRKRVTEVLPKAPPPPPKDPTPEELSQKIQSEDRFIRRLRMDMRAFVETLLRDRRFKAFWNPVDPSSAPDYYDIIEVPMDISKIAARIDLGRYPTVLGMVSDFDIMVKNAIQYNPPNTETGAAILRRAHGLIDIVHAWVDNLNPTVVETCNKIIADRVARAQKEIDAKEKVLKDVSNDQNDDQEKSVAEVAISLPGKEDVKIEKCGGAERLGHSPLKARIPVNALLANGGPDEVGALISRVTDEDAPRPPPLAERVNEEPAVLAKESEVSHLQRLLLAVSTGLTVDGLEGLYVMCARVLREKRHCRNRADVVRILTETVNEAREDPAVVGKLVA